MDLFHFIWNLYSIGDEGFQMVREIVRVISILSQSPLACLTSLVPANESGTTCYNRRSHSIQSLCLVERNEQFRIGAFSLVEAKVEGSSDGVSVSALIGPSVLSILFVLDCQDILLWIQISYGLVARNISLRVESWLRSQNCGLNFKILSGHFQWIQRFLLMSFDILQEYWLRSPKLLVPASWQIVLPVFLKVIGEFIGGAERLYL